MKNPDPTQPAQEQAKEHNPDAICGHCGLPFSNHHDEPTGIYCFEHTNGDTWTDEPDSEGIGDLIQSKHPEIWERFVAEWKQKNGHSVTPTHAPSEGQTGEKWTEETPTEDGVYLHKMDIDDEPEWAEEFQLAAGKFLKDGVPYVVHGGVWQRVMVVRTIEEKCGQPAGSFAKHVAEQGETFLPLFKTKEDAETFAIEKLGERDAARATISQLEAQRDSARKERDGYRDYAGQQFYMSDFRTADDMRNAYNTLRASHSQLEAQLAAKTEHLRKLVALYEAQYDDASEHRPDWLKNALDYTPSGQALLDRLAEAEKDKAAAVKEGIREGWRAAITLGNNVCVQESDRLNADDGSMEAIKMASDCGKRIATFIEPDDDYMATMLANLKHWEDAAIASAMRKDGQ